MHLGPLQVKQTGVTSSIDSSGTRWQWQLEQRVDFIVSPCCPACLRVCARACGVGWHLSSLHKLMRSIGWIAMPCSCSGREEEPVEALCLLAARLFEPCLCPRAVDVPALCLYCPFRSFPCTAYSPASPLVNNQSLKPQEQ
jgi:hypothetical protein